jgi:hypothetical protein
MCLCMCVCVCVLVGSEKNLTSYQTSIWIDFQTGVRECPECLAAVPIRWFLNICARGWCLYRANGYTRTNCAVLAGHWLVENHNLVVFCAATNIVYTCEIGWHALNLLSFLNFFTKVQIVLFCNFSIMRRRIGFKLNQLCHHTLMLRKKKLYSSQIRCCESECACVCSVNMCVLFGDVNRVGSVFPILSHYDLKEKVANL